MKVFAKTYPLRTTNEWLDRVKKAAAKNGNDSMKEFIEQAIEEKIKSVEGKEDESV